MKSFKNTHFMCKGKKAVLWKVTKASRTQPEPHPYHEATCSIIIVSFLTFKRYFYWFFYREKVWERNITWAASCMPTRDRACNLLVHGTIPNRATKCSPGTFQGCRALLFPTNPCEVLFSSSLSTKMTYCKTLNADRTLEMCKDKNNDTPTKPM